MARKRAVNNKFGKRGQKDEPGRAQSGNFEQLADPGTQGSAPSSDITEPATILPFWY
jgi:hypothetical protein